MRNKNTKKNIFFAVLIAILLAMPCRLLIAAEILNSTHYQIINPEIDSGGQLSGSTHYKSSDAVDQTGDTSESSTNYNLFPGLILPLYPNIPGVPTFQNSTGTYYNELFFSLSIDANSSATNYAIAISSNSFATTNFIQANDTIGSAPAWQTYTAWGGASGQLVVGLSSNTTYQIKVKARYGLNSETGYSAVASAATINPTLSVQISGVSSGTVINSITTNITTTGTLVAYGLLQPGYIGYGAQTSSVTTNATGGYELMVQENRDLTSANGSSTIPDVSGTNAAPAAWPTGVTTAAFGYHTTKNPLCIGTANRFSTDNTYAALSTSPAEVSCSTGPVTSDPATIIYKLEIEGQQVAGIYGNQVTYITTASY